MSKTKKIVQEEKQRKQADKVVRWIFICMILLALLLMFYFSMG